MAKGIDVYTKYQNVLNWQAVRAAGIEFCYVKVSDGTSTRATNNYGALGTRAGVVMGAYHYAQFGDPVAQANLLIDQAAANNLLDLAPALDLEDPFVPGTQAANFAIAFLKQVKARGHRPCLYANNSMLNSILAAVKREIPDVIVWVARYGANPTVEYHVWQYSSSGTVSGIAASAVDMNTGSIPFNLPSGSSGGNTSAVIDDEETTLKLEPGENRHLPIPVAGKPPYLYIAAGFGDWVDVHQIVFVGPTKGDGGNYIAGGYDQPEGQPAWRWVSDRPGPIRIPDGTAFVVIRYTTPFDSCVAYVG